MFINKSSEWIKKHKFFTCLIIAGLFAIPLVVIHFLFKIKPQSDFCQ